MQSQENIQYLKNFELKISEAIINVTSDLGLTDKQFIDVDELYDKWREAAPEYMADVVPQISDYPEVSLIWATYVGMAFACLWDKDWSKYKDNKNLYREIEKVRGFDYMDEYICEILVGMDLKGKDFKFQENVLRSAATKAINIIRRENIEPQTSQAFYAFARATNSFFKLGVTIALKKLKYSYVKMNS